MHNILLIALALLSLVANAAERPNILLLVSEDNGTFLGCYGDSLARTPTLDALAAEGVRFDNAYANAPVCAPARATLISGVPAVTTGTQHMRSRYRVPEAVPYFTRWLREAGYFTFNGGKRDYNRFDFDGEWDSSYTPKNWAVVPDGQPWFGMLNYMDSHESRMRKDVPLETDPAAVELPPYLPDRPGIRRDFARYYDCMAGLDVAIAETLAQLEADGLTEDTIVLYAADHAGTVPRTKRYLYDSGVRVPMILYVPEKWRHLFPDYAEGAVNPELVSFIDLAPTLLAVAEAEIPAHLPGRVFLGPNQGKEPETVFLFRGRMDEVTDMSRGVATRDFKYIRNYYPDLPHGDMPQTQLDANSYRAWRDAYEEGELAEEQSAFFEPKVFEELYDLRSDPHEIKNLADEDAYANTLADMRDQLDAQMLLHRDAGFMTELEGQRQAVIAESTVFNLAQDAECYSLAEYLALTEAIFTGKTSEAELRDLLGDEDPVVRYWALVGLRQQDSLDERTWSAVRARMEEDPSTAIEIEAAAQLFGCGDPAAEYRLTCYLEHRDEIIANTAAEAFVRHPGRVTEISDYLVRKLATKGRGYTQRSLETLQDKREGE